MDTVYNLTVDVDLSKVPAFTAEEQAYIEKQDWFKSLCNRIDGELDAIS